MMGKPILALGLLLAVSAVPLDALAPMDLIEPHGQSMGRVGPPMPGRGGN